MGVRRAKDDPAGAVTGGGERGGSFRGVYGSGTV